MLNLKKFQGTQEKETFFVIFNSEVKLNKFYYENDKKEIGRIER